MVDALVAFLDGLIVFKDRPHVPKIFTKVYSVLYSVASSQSLANRLYCARFLAVFRQQLSLKVSMYLFYSVNAQYF